MAENGDSLLHPGQLRRLVSTTSAVQALECSCNLQFANLCPEHDECFCKKVTLCLQPLWGQGAAVQVEMQMKSYGTQSGALLHPDGAGVLDVVHIAWGMPLTVIAGAARPVSARCGGCRAVALYVL